MTVYRTTWRALVVLATLVAGAAGLVAVGWPGLVGSAVLGAVVGGMLGFTWSPRGRERHLATLGAGWGLVVGELVLGLPAALGGAAFLLVVALALGFPPLVALGVREVRARRSVAALAVADRARLGVPELEERWRRTSADLARTRSAAAALRLVEERAVLLDEIQRRDPGRFAAILAGAGWRGDGSVVG